jgi:hypothetical protein
LVAIALASFSGSLRRIVPSDVAPYRETDPDAEGEE